MVINNDAASKESSSSASVTGLVESHLNALNGLEDVQKSDNIMGGDAFLMPNASSNITVSTNVSSTPVVQNNVEFVSNGELNEQNSYNSANRRSMAETTYTSCYNTNDVSHLTSDFSSPESVRLG